MHDNQDYPRILFFSSSHCAPCKPVELLLKKINLSMFGKKLHIEKIDIEKNIQITREYNVTAVPTLIISDKRLTASIQEEEIVDAILYGFISSVKL